MRFFCEVRITVYHLQIFCLFDYTFHTVLKNKLILPLKLAWGWTGPVGFRKKTDYLLIGCSLIFPSSARKAVVSSSSLSFKIPSSSPARGPPRQAAGIEGEAAHSRAGPSLFVFLAAACSPARVLFRTFRACVLSL